LELLIAQMRRIVFAEMRCGPGVDGLQRHLLLRSFHYPL
jgi:hypothetical protein